MQDGKQQQAAAERPRPCAHSEAELESGRATPGHHCGYVDARDALVEPALILAVRAARLDPAWGANVGDFVLGAHRADVVEQKFFAAMDWLAERAGLAKCTRVYDMVDRSVFQAGAPLALKLEAKAPPAPTAPHLRVIVGEDAGGGAA